MNIPIFKAKRIDNNEYVTGLLIAARFNLDITKKRPWAYFIEKISENFNKKNMSINSENKIYKNIYEIDKKTIHVCFDYLKDEKEKNFINIYKEEGIGSKLIQTTTNNEKKAGEFIWYLYEKKNKLWNKDLYEHIKQKL